MNPEDRLLNKIDQNTPELEALQVGTFIASVVFVALAACFLRTTPGEFFVINKVVGIVFASLAVVFCCISLMCRWMLKEYLRMKREIKKSE